MNAGPPSDDPDPRAELAALAEQARALLEWFAATGVERLDPKADPQRAHDQPETATQAVAVDRPVEPAPQGVPPVQEPEPAPEPPATTSDETTPRRGDDGRVERLAELATTVCGCTQCALAERRTHTVFARGNPHAELVFVGEGPGEEEDAQGVPFVGPAGRLLDRMIEAMGFRPDEVYISNVVKCRPPGNRKPEPAEMKACIPYLHQQLELLAPRIIVTLGATALEGLLEWHSSTGRGIGITRLRGTWKLYGGRIPLMPTFHPAYLLRSPQKKRDVWNDLQQVMQRLGKKPPAARSTRR